MKNSDQDQIKCPRCGSANFKKEESREDFASIKREGEPAKKPVEKLLHGYFCWDCYFRWYKPNELLISSVARKDF